VYLVISAVEDRMWN